MAKRVRDYAAEHARRNAKAREQGFSSYAAQRKARAQSKGKTRDHAAEYARRKAKAQRDGFSSPKAATRARGRARKALAQFDAAFGNRPKYNRARTLKRLQELEADSPEELDEVLDMSPGEMQAAMTPGKPYSHQPNLYYH